MLHPIPSNFLFFLACAAPKIHAAIAPPQKLHPEDAEWPFYYFVFGIRVDSLEKGLLLFDYLSKHSWVKSP